VTGNIGKVPEELVTDEPIPSRNTAAEKDGNAIRAAVLEL